MKKKIIITIISILLVAGAIFYLNRFGVNKDNEDNMTPTPTNTPTAISGVDEIKKLFSVKYNKDISEVQIIVAKETDSHMVGGVKFDQGDMSEGGMFLAAKVNGSWILTYDGNGSISCDAVDPFNFPADMVGECIDKTGNPVDRANSNR